MEIPEARKLKSLEEENRKLKKFLAETMLDVSALTDMLGKKLLTPSLRRLAVTGRSMRRVTHTRACRFVGLQPMTYRYASDDASLKTRLKELASQRRRFGFWSRGCYWPRKAFGSITNSFTGSRTRNDLRWVGANARWALGHRCRSRRIRTCAGRDGYVGQRPRPEHSSLRPSQHRSQKKTKKLFS